MNMCTWEKWYERTAGSAGIRYGDGYRQLDAILGDLRIVELPNFADLSMESKDPYGRDMDQWPIYRAEGADAMLRHVDGFIGYAQSRGVAPFLSFYFHPWEFYPMPQGDIRSSEGAVRPDPFITKNCGDYAVDQLDLLIRKLLERGAEFIEARRAAQHW